MIAANFAEIQRRVAAASARGKFKQAVRILPVTKTVSAAQTSEVIAVQQAAGLSPIIGESYLTDFLKKREFLQGVFEAHFIGPLQEGAIAKIVRVFDVIHSVPSVQAAQKIAREAQRLGRVVSIFVQVNISNDPAKQGTAVEGVAEVIAGARSVGLSVLGLMAITRDYQDPEQARGDFARLREVRDELLPEGGLSMGMSGDFEVAVEEGATVVRVGSALFGAKL